MSDQPTIQNSIDNDKLLIPDLDRRDTHGNPEENLEDGQAVLYYEAGKLFYAENCSGNTEREILSSNVDQV